MRKQMLTTTSKIFESPILTCPGVVAFVEVKDYTKGTKTEAHHSVSVLARPSAHRGYARA